jgi:hypothetical protein
VYNGRTNVSGGVTNVSGWWNKREQWRNAREQWRSEHEQWRSEREQWRNECERLRHEREQWRKGGRVGGQGLIAECAGAGTGAYVWRPRLVLLARFAAQQANTCAAKCPVQAAMVRLVLHGLVCVCES